MTTNSNAEMSRVVDFDIHGIVGVRLEGASPAEVRTVERQLGAMQGALVRRPDIVLRFSEAVIPPVLRYGGTEACGYDGEAFYLLAPGRRRAGVRIDFQRLGHGCELLCDRGLAKIPFLSTLVTVCALRAGYVPIHASGCLSDGVGMLLVGWAGGGKTSALLAFASRGAAYVGDDWILVSADGGTMRGIPQRICVRDWQLRQLPGLRRRVSYSRRLAMSAAGAVERCLRAACSAVRDGTLLRIMDDLANVFHRRINVQLEANVLFGARAAAHSAKPQRVFLLVKHDGDDIDVEPLDSSDLIGRLVAINQAEQEPLMEAYRTFLFAWPERTSALLDDILPLQRQLLATAFENARAWVVGHPSPCDLESLHAAMQPYVKYGTAAAGAEMGRSGVTERAGALP
jgi:hypothetical protein